MHCDVSAFEICMNMFGLYPHEYVQLVGIQTSPTHINIYINLGSVKSNPKYLSEHSQFNQYNCKSERKCSYCHDKYYPSEYTALLVINPAAYIYYITMYYFTSY